MIPKYEPSAFLVLAATTVREKNGRIPMFFEVARMLFGPDVVLSNFPPPWNRPPREIVPQHSGWSGGQVWRVHTEGSDAALRCWPAGFPLERIHVIHQLQKIACDCGCSFIPQIIPSLHRTTTHAHDNRTWELATWMPGQPTDFAGPTQEQIEKTARAIAQWHQSLCPTVVPAIASGLGTKEAVNAFRARALSPSPGIRRRISEWRRLTSLFHDRRSAILAPEFASLTSRTRAALQKHASIIDSLERWGDLPLEMVVSLPDLHREHVLFEEGRVSGIIDFGGMTIDTPAMELVRFASSFDGGKSNVRTNIQLLLKSYREQKQLGSEVDDLVVPLAVASVAIGVLHWWEWLTIDGTKFRNNQSGAMSRWDELIHQLEFWPAEVFL